MKKNTVKFAAHVLTFFAALLFVRAAAPVLGPHFTALGELPVGINLYMRGWPDFWFVVLITVLWVLAREGLHRLIDKKMK